MCLIIHTFTPYNKSKFRWKIFARENYCKEKCGDYISCFRREFRWVDNKAKQDADTKRHTLYKDCSFEAGGFHVFINRKDARKSLKLLKLWGGTYKSCVVRKVKVDNFICGGLTHNVGNGMNGLKSEAWGEVEILD